MSVGETEARPYGASGFLIDRGDGLVFPADSDDQIIAVRQRV
jgi:hypothetical protein